MKVVTTSPFYSNLTLRTGLDPKSAAYMQTLAALPEQTTEFFIPNQDEHLRAKKYETIDEDDYDLRLFVFSPKTAKDAPKIDFHIYANGISIVTVTFDVKSPLSAEPLAQHCQDLTRSVFEKHSGQLETILQKIREKLPTALLDKQKVYPSMSQTNICWISRAVILDKASLKNKDMQSFITEWLENTARPEDAEALITGNINFSMTWLNYLIIEPTEVQRRTLFSALRTSQFFYAAQEYLNDNAYRALTNSALEKNVRIVERRLTTARRDMQMLHIMYDTKKTFMTRKKRQLVNDLMEIWDFDILKANGERMVAASNTKIAEITNKRSERSSFFTDLILVGLALVTVIEVSMYLTEYSREVMSRPTLAYQDDETSWILTAIAAIDTDQMLIGGAFVILILVCFYVYWKIRR